MNDKIEKIEIKDIKKRFRDGTVALRNINITLESKEGLIGILGPNGAGKTTLLRILSTVLPPTEGKLLVNQEEVEKYGMDRYRIQIGYLPQEFGIYPQLTPYQFLKRLGFLYKMDKSKMEKRISEIADMVKIKGFLDKPLSACSGGMVKRVGLAQAILQEPDFLILDEPLVGLDPVERIKIMKVLTNLSHKKIIIFSTHVISEIESLCYRVIMLNEGKILSDDKVEELTDSMEGRVFEGLVSRNEVMSIVEKYHAVKMRDEGKKVKLRLLLDEDGDLKNFRKVRPTLEDAYLSRLENV